MFNVEVLFVIDGDAHFAAAAQTEGWPGDGSAGYSYVIDGLDIDLAGGSGHCISISNTRVNFTISNCNMIGASSGAGIYLENVTYGKLLENSFDGNSYGIYLSLSNSITVANNTCTGNNYGIYLYGSRFNTLSHNTCSNNNVGIYIVGIGLWWISQANTVANNTCSNNAFGIYLDQVDINNVANNTCTSNDRGINLADSNSNTVVNNTCTSNNDGIRLYSSDSNTVANNTCSSNSFRGIYLEQSDSNTVANNTCTSNTDGISLNHSHSNTVSDNTCTNNIYGIFLNESPGNTVANNTCTSNTDYGIMLAYSDSNTVTNNTCSINNYGIYIYAEYSSSTSNTLSENTCTSNNYGIYLYLTTHSTVANNTCTSNNYGIYLKGSTQDTVANNTCTSNNHGIYVEYAGSNHITWNVFADNSLNGLQTGGSNAFDYNFWSDYAGTDANDDGIGDTPYYGSGFVDPHPLMYLPTPPTWIEPPADQTVEFEHLFYYELPILYYGPLIGSISDTTHFTIDNRGVVESTGILPIGDYGLRVDVTSIYGFSITATFHVTVVVDGNNPPGWLTIPTDQSLAYGEKFEYQITTIDPSGIDYWILSDTVHFILSVSFFDGGSTARITNNSVLELGSYGLEITVYDVYGNPLKSTVMARRPHRPNSGV
jgi:parallel beta-helix repeat protein